MNFINMTMDYEFLKKFESNLSILHTKLIDKNDRLTFFSRFPFHGLVNISIIDKESLSLAISILLNLNGYEEFYNIESSLFNVMEFILVNLSLVMTDCYELECLFELLHKVIIQRLTTSLDDYFKIHKERIGNVLLHVVKIVFAGEANSINKYINFYNIIIEYLFKTSMQDLPSTIDSTICDMFTVFKNYQIISANLSMVNLILERYETVMWDSFNVIYDWILEECVNCVIDCFVKRNEYLEQSLKILRAFCLKLDETSKLCYSYVLTSFFQSIMNISYSLCTIATNENLRIYCYDILQSTLPYFFAIENISIPVNKNGQVENFEIITSLNVTSFYLYDYDIIFAIYHMVFKCGSQEITLWKKEDLLQLIANYFYKRQSTISLGIIKSVYYLYAELVDFPTKISLQIKTLGDDLITYFLQFCHVSYCYSAEYKQLKWMLLCKEKKIKLSVIRHWMEFCYNEITLIQTIKECKVERLLIDIMYDDVNNQATVGKMAAVLLQKMSSSSLSNIVGVMIPLTIDKPTVLFNLLLSKPSLPTSLENSLLMCTIMCTLLVMINDDEVLRAACIYTSKLLASLNTNSKSIEAFCKIPSNIRCLITKAKVCSNEETVIEIIRLLKVVIIIQKTNGTVFPETIVENLDSFLMGSTIKISKSISLLKHIIIGKNLIIKLSEDSVLKVYRKLLDLSYSLELAELAYDCITALFKSYYWLAVLSRTIVFIEVTCLSKPNLTQSALSLHFAKMVMTWIKIIKRERTGVVWNLPLSPIKSFVVRSGLKAEIASSLLNDLKMLSRKSEVVNGMVKVF